MSTAPHRHVKANLTTLSTFVSSAFPADPADSEFVLAVPPSRPVSRHHDQHAQDRGGKQVNPNSLVFDSTETAIKTLFILKIYNWGWTNFVYMFR
jgi:hypothetical protein